MDKDKIFSYKNYNYKNYNIKELLFKKLKLKNDYKVETLKDIEEFSILFCKYIPFCTFDAGIGKDEYNIDYTISCIQKGGICVQLNIIFGLFLKQIFNIEVYLMKSVEFSPHNTIKELGWHFYNVFIWTDKKVYFHDVGLYLYNVFSPIELNNDKFISLNNKCVPQPYEHRIIINNSKIEDKNGLKSYILQRKQENGIISIMELKLDINSLEDNINFKKIYEISNNFHKSKSRLILFYSEEGIVSLSRNTFMLFSSKGPSYNIKIKIKENSQFYDIFLKYFNINLKDDSYYSCFLFSPKL